MNPFRRRSTITAILSTLLVAVTVLLPRSSRAQAGEVRGVVRDSASGLPVTGAVVLALDAIGTTLSRTITGARGQYRLTRPANTMLVRALRLGYRPITERLPQVRAEVDVVDFVLPVVPRTLAAMDVTAAQGCPTRGDRAEAYGLLDQARAGLLATIVARERQPAMLQVLRFERYLDLDGINIERQYVRIDSSVNAKTSFNAVQSAVDFVQRGFRSGPVGQYTYLGPDADVLLDERFQRGYCFSIAQSDTARAKHVGLRFVPASRRTGRVDIEGTLWIDTTARALSDIEFKYVGIEALGESFNSGGSVGFRTLPSGVPFIDRWSMRLVGAPDTMVTDAGASSQVYAIREIGGELARASWADGQKWDGALGAVHLTAVTRTGAPAAGAVLNLVNTDYRVTTDQNGRATISHLIPGPYAVVIDDPTLQAIGLQIPTTRSFEVSRGSALLARVTVPSTQQFVGGICGRDPAETDIPAKEAWVLARVFTGGRPVPGAKWRISLADGARWRVVSENGITGSNGLIAYCKGLQRNTSVEVAAWRDPKDAIRVQRILEEPISVVRVTLPLLAPVATVAARRSEPPLTVSGTVKDSVTGAIVPDARVTFMGTPFEGATDSSGTFVVGGVPPGEYTVEVSTPRLDSIGAVDRRVVTLTDRAATLALFVPSLAEIVTAACGTTDGSGFVVGRVQPLGDSKLPLGLRVVAEWADLSADTSAASAAGGRVKRILWTETPTDDRGTYRLCGVPGGARVALRTEADSASAYAAAPLNIEIPLDRRYARADLQLDSVVVALASFSGSVIADTVGAPLENAEVTITDIGRTVLTDRRGAFRVSDIPLGVHLVSVKRVGYAPVLTSIDFDANRAVTQRVLMNKASALATVEVTADANIGLSEFEERRKLGIGRYLARADLDKHVGRRLGDVLTQVSGFGASAQAAGHAWVVGKRAPSKILARSPAPVNKTLDSHLKCGGPNEASCGITKEDLRQQGFYCPSSAESTQGLLGCACFAQVYIDGRLMNTSRPTEPFDANTIPVEDVAGVEFYGSAASTPGRYSSLNATCGVMLVWTRRRT